MEIEGRLFAADFRVDRKVGIEALSTTSFVSITFPHQNGRGVLN